MTELPQVRVTIESGDSAGKEYFFQEPFQIGREPSCKVQLNDSAVSRLHAEVVFEDGQWWLQDLQSSNGTYVAGSRIDRIPVAHASRIEVGSDGPLLSLCVEQETVVQPTLIRQRRSVTGYLDYYFGDQGQRKAGRHTMMLRTAFEKVQKGHRLRYYKIIAVVSGLLIIVGSYAIYQHFVTSKQLELAEEMFYSMKTLDIELGQLESTILGSDNLELSKQLYKIRLRRKEMEKAYESYLSELGTYESDMSEEERIILRIARIFGECELNVPKAFTKEIMKYIQLWQSTPRYKRAIERAQRNNYPSIITSELLRRGVQPQFFYLALQESDFKKNISGPRTRFGIAKGLWQFIPATAREYGLKTGPLVRVRKADPRDERLDAAKSTKAAAKYLKSIYNTEAQASGLLVMASYNYGPTRIRKLINSMPDNPRERNFWRLLTRYRNKIPKQTYDYVFYIVSAAVIGENPRLFGFEFDNPLSKAITENEMSTPEWAREIGKL